MGRGRTLRFTVGHRDARCLAVLVDPAAGDDSADGVMVPLGHVEGLENQETATFAPAEARSPAIKGKGPAMIGEESVTPVRTCLS